MLIWRFVRADSVSSKSNKGLSAIKQQQILLYEEKLLFFFCRNRLKLLLC
jgi:hypothetical protein